jgi:anti-sigma factor RsiW
MSSHLSEEQIAAWVAGERSGEVAAHLAGCPACAAEVERTANALALFRESSAQCAAYWAGQPARKGSRVWRWAIAAPVIAALVLAAVLVRRPAIAPAPVEHAQTGFVRIPYVVPPLPYERTEIVQMNVPVAALISVGFRRDEPAGASVPAEVLVGQDDRPLAIRILE